SYGNLAIQELERGHSGLMVALQNGVYTTVPADMPTLGVKRVNVHELYDAQEYRPHMTHLIGKPMFLY
ncbi:MAG: phosphofructokinase, partial [Oscillochloris sp.]|nr:phosphofructokinase [Oscillochloris sp.]